MALVLRGYESGAKIVVHAPSIKSGLATKRGVLRVKMRVRGEMAPFGLSCVTPKGKALPCQIMPFRRHRNPEGEPP